VRRLLHDEGYTIKGVQRLHREQGVRRLVAAGEGQGVPAAPAERPGLLKDLPVDAVGRDRLAEILEELEAAKQRLDDILKG
jgi:hypothetical protein